MRWHIAILLAVLACPNYGQAQTDKTKRAARSRQGHAKKEDLRYNGRPFSYWQKYDRNELSAERRIQTLHAMAAFGARGYGKEAAKVILEIVKEYGEEAYEYSNGAPQNPDQRVVEEARWAFHKIGADGTPVLFRRISEANVKLFANAVLSRVHWSWGNAEQGIEFYVLAVQSQDKQIRSKTISALKLELGYDSGIRPAFQKYFEKNDVKPFRDALIRFVKEEEIPRKGIEEEDSFPSFPALHLIGALGPKAKSAFTELRPIIDKILRSDGSATFGRSLRRQVLTVLKEMDVSSKQTVPYLVEFLQYERDQEKKGNKETTRFTGRNTKYLRTGFVCCQRREPYFKDTIIKELAAHGPKAKKAIPLLMDAYKTGDDVTRTFVAKALGAIGPAAKSAVPVLHEALKARDAELRQAAATAIRQITGEKGDNKDSKKPE